MKRLALLLALALALPSVRAQGVPVVDWNIFPAPPPGVDDGAAGAFQNDGCLFLVRQRTGPGADLGARLFKVGPEGRIEWDRPVGVPTSHRVWSRELLANAQGEPTVLTVSTVTVNGTVVGRHALERYDRWGGQVWTVSDDPDVIQQFDPIRWKASLPGALVLTVSQGGLLRDYRCKRLGPDGQMLHQADLNALFGDDGDVYEALESPNGEIFVSGRTSGLQSFVKSVRPQLDGVAWHHDFGQAEVIDMTDCRDGRVAVISKRPGGGSSQDLTMIDRTGAVAWTVNYYEDDSHGLRPTSVVEGPNGRLYVSAVWESGGALNETLGFLYVFEPNGVWAWFSEFWRGVHSGPPTASPGPGECAAVEYAGSDPGGPASTAIDFISGNGQHVWSQAFTPGTLNYDNLFPIAVVDPADAVLVGGTAVKSDQSDRLWIGKYLLQGTGTVAPSALKVSIGKLEKGTATDLRLRDENAVRFGPLGTGAGAFRAQVVIDGVQTLSDRTPVAVNLATRLSAGIQGSLAVDEWDWSKSKWAVVRSKTAVSEQADSVVLPLPGPYARFVGPHGEMRARLTFAYQAPPGAASPRVLLDKCTWTALAP